MAAERPGDLIRAKKNAQKGDKKMWGFKKKRTYLPFFGELVQMYTSFSPFFFCRPSPSSFFPSCPSRGDAIL
jgi:hypothetical protein